MRRALVVFLLSALGGCESEKGNPAPPAAATAPASSSDLWASSDARRLDEVVLAGLGAGDVGRRREAFLAAARLHRAAEAEELLLRGLRDPAAEVRSAAALGLAALEEDASDRVETAMIAAIAVETDAALRGELAWDVGRVARERGEDSLVALLGDSAAGTREGACRGLGALAQRRGRLRDETRARLGGIAELDPAPQTRALSAYALSRDSGAGCAEGVRGHLERAATDADASVRTMAVRALAGCEASVGVLQGASRDASPVVAMYALRGLAREGMPEGAIAEAAEWWVERAIRSGSLRDARVALVALEGLRSVARGGRGEEGAYRVLERSQAAMQRPNDAVALVHCGAAAAMDVAQGWPVRTPECGGGRVPSDVRQAWEAEVLGASEGSDAQRALRLGVLAERGEGAGRTAAVLALAHVRWPFGRAAVISSLVSRDTGLATAAADTLSQAASAADVARETIAADIELGTALAAAGAYLTAEHDAEGELTWLGAVEALRVERFDGAVRELIRSPHPAVREKAAGMLGLETADEVPVRAPVTRAALDRPLPGRIRLETSRGPIVLDLDATHAPVTVLRFVDRVRAGFYDGLTFHRVVPGFVVQGGDPRGDGYGGPGYTQRCEDNRVRYDRGTVGMALAGRDTGGSQFFITESRQPHLDGHYTAFAHVSEGMEIAETLVAGDRILRAVAE